MTDRPRKERPSPSGPDGEPKQPPADPDSTTQSKVLEVQNPLISGDAGKPGAGIEAGEANVDEAGQVRRNRGDVDLLH